MATVALTRIGVVTTLGVVLAVLAGGIFDGARWSLLIAPAAAGAGVALVDRLGGWPRLARGGLVAASLAGGLVATVAAEGGSVSATPSGLIRGPRRLLTTEWPSPTEPTVVATVALLVGVGVWIAAELARRERFHVSPLLPLLVVAVALIGLAAPNRPGIAVVLGLVVPAMVLVVLRPGEGGRSRLRAILGDRTVAVSVSAVAIVALASATSVAWADRADPRRTEDAQVTSTLIDPVEAMVALRRAEPEFPLYRVTDRSTLVRPSLPARWRIAALENYDGQRWLPQLTLRPIGARLGVADPTRPEGIAPIAYDLEILTDDIDLLPFPGPPLWVSVPVETDVDRVAVRLATMPDAPTTIAARSEVAPSAIATPTAGIVPRPVDEIAATFTERATRLAGDDPTVLGRLRQIERTMRNDWRLDPGAPGGGQQLALLERFARDTRRGTAEQFVTTFVLLVRSLGLEARVASGFVLRPEDLDSPLVIGSQHAAVWPEVLVDGVGWLAFDPVPPNETTDAEEAPPPPRQQSPAAAQPPIAPPVETSDDTEVLDPDADTETGRWSTVQTWLVRVAIGGGIGVLPFAAVIGTILFLKWRRRRERLRVPDPASRIRGVWANVTDALVDAGLAIRPAWTDERIAEVGAPLAPGVRHELRRLAASATAMRFGSVHDAPRLLDDAISSAAAVAVGIRESRTRWQRIRWRLSLRSLRPSTRSPVVA